MNIDIYSDGSATTANQPGGWGVVIVVDGQKRHELSGHITKATNNMAEIQAAIEGMNYVVNNYSLGNTVVLISDSQLVLKYCTGEYVCRKFHLQLLCSQLKAAYQKLGATTRWVKGHSGDPNNEKCDELAKTARSTPGSTTHVSFPVTVGTTDPVGQIASTDT